MPIENETTRPEARLTLSGTVTRVGMAGPGQRRILFVRVACVVAVALFVTTSAMIYFGWREEKEPVAVIIVDGSASFADATVTITGTPLPTPLTRTFAEGTGYRLRFHVPPGVYRLQVSRGTTLLYFNDTLTVDRGPLEIDPFAIPGPGTKSTTARPPT